MSKSTKKIICTVTNDLSYDQRMIRICNSLVRQGFEVTLVGRTLPKSIPLQKQKFQQERLKCFFHQGKLFYLEFNLRLLFFLFGQSFQMVCSVDLDTLVPGFLVSRIKGKVCIYDAHEYFTEVPEVVNRPFTKWVWNQVASWIIPRLQYAYTVGPELAQIFNSRYRTEFATIRNLPLRQDLHIIPPDKNDDKIILYQGRLNVGRGIETAILAMHHIEGAKLWLAGEGDLSQSLRDLVKNEGLEDKVNFLGYLTPEALQMVTLEAYIGLNLLENNGLNYYYSLANKAFDYIQVGLPSIQMDFPEYRALQDQYGGFNLLPELEVSSLVGALHQLINDPDYWLKLHQNCLAARKELSWEEEEKKLAQFYASIV